MDYIFIYIALSKDVNNDKSFVIRLSLMVRLRNINDALFFVIDKQ